MEGRLPEAVEYEELEGVSIDEFDGERVGCLLTFQWYGVNPISSMVWGTSIRASRIGVQRCWEMSGLRNTAGKVQIVPVI